MIKLLRALVSNLASLLFAFIIALLLWARASQVEDPTTRQFLQLPIQIVGMTEDSILSTPTDRQNVQIVFEGPDSIVSQMSTRDFTATANISEVPFGINTNVPVQITLPQNDRVSLISQSPEAINILLEESVSREIPVNLNIRGTVARGHERGEELIEPSLITVIGPASQVEELAFARATVFLNNEQADFFDSPQLVFYDKQGIIASVRGLSLSAEQVDVTIPIDESDDFAEKFITVNLVGDPADGYRLLSASPEPRSVLVQGRPTQLNNLTGIETTEIDITGLAESFSQQVTLDLPNGVTIDREQEIFVNVEIEPIRTTDTYNREVEVLGLEPPLIATIDPDSVRVVLFGPVAILDSLSEDDVRVTIDVFGLEPGTYSVEPVANIPDRGIEFRSFQPALVTVNITQTLTNTAPITNRILLPTSSLPSLRNIVDIAVPHDSKDIDRTQLLWPPQKEIL